MLTALQLAEQLDLICGMVKGKNSSEICGIVRMAEKALRGETKAQPMTEDEVRFMIKGCESGKEFAVYVEDRSYYKPMAVIIDGGYGDSVRLLQSNGMHEVMDLARYNKTWRLWAMYPSGVEMKMTEWRDRK